MTGLIIFLIILLLAVIIIQISKVSDLSAQIRGEEQAETQKNNRTALYCLLFLIGFMIYCVATAIQYKDIVLWYGPNSSASAHGFELDALFNVTAVWTGIVFFMTQIALFWFAYKYRSKKGNIATFFHHSNLLEGVWTIVPTLVLVYLVVEGLVVWNEVMPDVDPSEDYIEIEAAGYQFAWDIRYPGADGKLGARNYTLINPGSNPLGQDWSDTKNIDDMLIGSVDFVLPVNQKVRVRITAKDVLHNFYLPHHRVKMDAIPGLPTYFIFTPVKTTEEYREQLRGHPDWEIPADPEEPDGPKRWEAFEYELACAELCGKGHYSMRRVLRVVSQEEYEAWLAEQPSYYMSNVRNTAEDPFKGQLLEPEIQDRSREFNAQVDAALATPTDDSDNLINLKHVFFNTGSAQLNGDLSKYELNNIVKVLNKYSNINIELGGHTDSTGDAGNNQALSERRADAVKTYLVSKGIADGRIRAVGYGQTSPVDSNDTEEGRQNNRRTEMKILNSNI